MAFDYTSGNPNNLTGAGPAAMTDIQGPFVDLKTFLNARIAAVPTLVSSLPVGPTDGQEVYFLADSSNGVVWHLRYRSASASTYKWEFVGGPSLYTDSTSLSTVSLATYQAAPLTAMTAPLAGDYRMRVDGVGFATAGAQALLMVPTINAVMPAAGGTEELRGGAITTATSTQGESFGRPSTRTVTGAGQAVGIATRVVTAGNNGTSYYRSLEITPVRVG